MQVLEENVIRERWRGKCRKKCFARLAMLAAKCVTSHLVSINSSNGATCVHNVLRCPALEDRSYL